MINKLYSILVSGCNVIPNNFSLYRKYNDIRVDIPEIPKYKDPYRRSLWANYMIGISRTSDLYECIQELDPTNSYDVCTERLPYICDTKNADILVRSDLYPVLKLSGDVQDSVVTYTYNGVGPIMSDITTNRTIDILGYKISLPKDDGQFNINISNPAVSVDIPTVDAINKNIHYVSDLAKNIDINDAWDRAAIFCVYALRRYNGERS